MKAFRFPNSLLTEVAVSDGSFFCSLLREIIFDDFARIEFRDILEYAREDDRDEWQVQDYMAKALGETINAWLDTALDRRHPGCDIIVSAMQSIFECAYCETTARALIWLLDNNPEEE